MYIVWNLNFVFKIKIYRLYVYTISVWLLTYILIHKVYRENYVTDVTQKIISVKIFTRYCKPKYYNLGNDKSFVTPKRMFIALKVSTIITFAKHFSGVNSILTYNT